MAVVTAVLGDGVTLAWAPGRATVLGDHTDYNYGLAIAVATRAGTTVTTRPATRWSFSSDAPGLAIDWVKYPQACIDALDDAGIGLRPAGIQVTSGLPHGRGLSSSTSLTTATLSALASANGVDLAPERLAALSQDVENTYLGIPSGSLDQAVIVHADNGVMQYFDFAVSTATSLPTLRLPRHRFVLVDSGQSRRLGPHNIGARRFECSAAAQAAAGSTGAGAWQRIQAMSERQLDSHPLTGTQRRRIDHVRSENSRTAALASGADSMTEHQLADLINSSHESLRDKFEVSTRVLEDLRDSLLYTPGVLAARVVGAGFGGCLLVLVEDPHMLPHRFLELATPVEEPHADR